MCSGDNSSLVLRHVISLVIVLRIGYGIQGVSLFVLEVNASVEIKTYYEKMVDFASAAKIADEIRAIPTQWADHDGQGHRLKQKMAILITAAIKDFPFIPRNDPIPIHGLQI
ncbi:hypothetical protein NPIL_374521 [Nephila pilipes]|uniref:Uncharacterized protein n=1 Tax=Nephila pilipes TaxID=299642 RepID=A0A8X6N3L2_NEPPI|nr:hypothetical protein NPIL_374521 [Nephila pilipes]